MGYPTGQGPEHDPHRGNPQYGNPQYGWPQQQWPSGPYNSQGGWSPDQKPSGGGSGRALIIVGVVTALLVVAVVVVGAIALGRNHSGDDESVSAAGSSSTAAASESTSASAQPGSPTGSECPPATAGPNTPAGWKTVTGTRGLAYDVPPTWDVASCGAVVGWEKKCQDGPFGYCPIRTMGGAATLESARCPKNSLAVAGLPGASNTDDINTAVRAEADLVADIYTSDSGRVPTVTLSRPRTFTVGGAAAVQIVASVTGIESSACVGPAALHSMIATTVPGQKGCVMFVISLPQGVPGAVAPAVGDEMVSTLRRAD